MRILRVRDYRQIPIGIHEIPLPFDCALETLDDRELKIEKITISFDDLCAAINYLMGIGALNAKFIPRKNNE